MTIDKKLDNGTLTISVGGRLDTNTAPELEAALKFDGATSVVFDFAELEYISSAGLRVLMTAHKTLAAAGGGVKVLNPNEMVRGVFDMTGLSDILEIG